MPLIADVQRILEGVPVAFRVPGGAVAVVKDGELAGEKVWGFANLDERIPVSPKTIFPICSISKQMVCLVLTKLLRDDSDKSFEHAFNIALHKLLPKHVTADQNLTTERLVAMQSGLRDYWALTVLWGARPGGRFSIYQDAPKALQRLGGFHFEPGTQMSYCNTNFMAVGLAIEKATGQTLGDLLGAIVFQPAGMKSAALRPDTERIPPPCIGYEGSEEKGYIPYQNRIEWAGDAGIQASLEDMIAYEKYVDRCTIGNDSVYSKNASQPHYSNGDDANYGHGLIHGNVGAIKTIGHSGGLAGFRLYRMYAPEKRTSVIVLFNSEPAVTDVAPHILKKMFGSETEDAEADAEEKLDVTWTGCYLDDEGGIAIEIRQDRPGEVLVNYGGHEDKLKIKTNDIASCDVMHVTYETSGQSIRVLRPKEHRSFTARPLSQPGRGIEDGDAPDYTGSYRSEKIDSTFHCTGSGEMLYGHFEGYLGSGPAHLMRHLGEDVWYLSCERSLDAPPPGKWTVIFHRSEDGQRINGATIGCWLARKIPFEKLEH